MIVRILLWILVVVGVIVGLLFGFVWLAAFSDGLVQCPGGSDCPDAKLVTKLGFSVFVVCAVTVGASLWGLGRKAETNS